MTETDANRATKAYDIAIDRLNSLYKKLWATVIVLILILVGMWIININGGILWNAPIALVSLIGTAFVAFKPRILLPVMGLGAAVGYLGDRDTTQGTLRGLEALHKVVLGIMYVFTAAAMVLSTYGFEHNPMAFWVVVLVITALVVAHQFYGQSSSKRPLAILSVYGVIAAIAWLTTTANPALSGVAFDPRSAEPLMMVEPDTRALDKLSRTPADCRPAGASHEGFDYRTQGTCRSVRTGNRLVPITAGDAKELGILDMEFSNLSDLNPFGGKDEQALQGSVDNPYTPALGERIAVWSDAHATVFAEAPRGYRYLCSSANLRYDGPVDGSSLIKLRNEYGAGDGYIEFRQAHHGPCRTVEEDPTVSRAPKPGTAGEDIRFRSGTL